MGTGSMGTPNITVQSMEVRGAFVEIEYVQRKDAWQSVLAIVKLRTI